LGGLDVGSVVPFVGSVFVIGRDSKCNLILRDDGISRQHVEVKRTDDDFIIVRDLGSTNGTFIDGKKITEATLRDGEKVLLGRRTVLKFVMQDELEQSYQIQMYESSTRDGLTGTFNRKYFVQKIVADLSFAKRHGIPFSLLLLDIDFFKKVNDTHGHRTGDQALVSVTEAINATIRTEDLLARYGGEEFAVIAQGTNLVGGEALGERIRKRIAETDIPIADESGKFIKVTVSIGVATLPPGVAAQPEAVVSAADKNLYQAKEAGRNRVVASRIG
jgi:two-component system, cell cycle response regulator